MIFFSLLPRDHRLRATSLCLVDCADVHLTIKPNDSDDWVSPINLSLLLVYLFKLLH